MPRLPDWPALLARHILEATDRDFAWGSHDCCTFACDGVLVLTGRDPMFPARGLYRDEKRAAVILRAIGGGGLPEAADVLMDAFAAPRVHPAFAQRGDLVLINAPVLPAENLRAQNGLAGGVLRAENKDWCMGLIAPNGQVAVAAPKGLAFFEPRAAARAWRI
ncbi:MAG: hypothetical protein ING19_05290 [Azospirillum sp.]|nr:hypothetical protein [Azospirillum sp.]MCA3265466.1 hypothetical protein [Azospirillum sp.]